MTMAAKALPCTTSLAGHAHWHAALHQQFCTIICEIVGVGSVAHSLHQKCLCEVSELHQMHVCSVEILCGTQVDMLHSLF